jgi:hypothetical protein
MKKVFCDSFKKDLKKDGQTNRPEKRKEKKKVVVLKNNFVLDPSECRGS